MAQKRMFSLQVTDTDQFMDMPTSSQALYFHLGMHGDDDGFVASPKKIARAAGCGDDDLRLLVAKGYIIPFESGVVVITDWKTNNYIQSDRYHKTLYTQEMALLKTGENGKYSLVSNLDTKCIQAVSILETENRLDKTRLDKTSIEGKGDKPPTCSRFVAPSEEEVAAYCHEKGYTIDPTRFVNFYTSKGWKVGSSPMKDWKAAVRNWASREKGTAAPPAPAVKKEDLWTL